MKIRHYLIALTVLVLDHVVKYWVAANLDPAKPVDIFVGYLRLSYAENTGVAFGFFDSVDFPYKPYILGALALAAVVIIVAYGARSPADRALLHYGLALTVGGILGNFIDRVLHGYVIDYIDFHIQDIFHWPAFNIADSCITIGIALLLIDALKNPEPEGGRGDR